MFLTGNLRTQNSSLKMKTISAAVTRGGLLKWNYCWMGRGRVAWHAIKELSPTIPDSQHQPSINYYFIGGGCSNEFKCDTTTISHMTCMWHKSSSCKFMWHHFLPTTTASSTFPRRSYQKSEAQLNITAPLWVDASPPVLVLHTHVCR